MKLKQKWQVFFLVPMLIVAMTFSVVAAALSDVVDYDNTEVSERIEIPPSQQPSLHEIYADYFLIGNIMHNTPYTGVNEELFARHHNVATAENAHKAVAMQPYRGDFRFAQHDAIVEQAIEHGMLFHGHTLIWTGLGSSPAWMNEAVQESREAAREIMYEHITTLVTHFNETFNTEERRNFISWDVVNEALEESPVITTTETWPLALNPRIPWNIGYSQDGGCPGDHIIDAFKFARRADPQAILFYNDFSMDHPAKRLAAYNMIKDINTRFPLYPPDCEHARPLIDGIGLQAHHTTNVDPDAIRYTIQLFASLGIDVVISELGVSIGNSTELLSERDQLLQGIVYAQLFEVYMELSDYISRVTWWGLRDDFSWQHQTSPTLFDRYAQPKRAFDAIVDPIGFLTTYAGLENDAVSISPDRRLFETMYVGYEPIEAQEIVVTNTTRRGVTFTGLNVALRYGIAFDIEEIVVDLLEPGESLIIVVSPKDNLPAGDYYDEIIFTDDEFIERVIPLYVRVLEEPIVLPAGILYAEDFSRHGFAIREEWFDLFNINSWGFNTDESYLDIWYFNEPGAFVDQIYHTARDDWGFDFGEPHLGQLAWAYHLWTSTSIGPNATGIAYSGGLEWTDYSFEISTRLSFWFDNDEFIDRGLLFRASEAAYYMIAINSTNPMSTVPPANQPTEASDWGKIYLYRVENFHRTLLAEPVYMYDAGIQFYFRPDNNAYRVDPAHWHQMRVDVVGNRIIFSIFVDDEDDWRVVFDVIDDNPLAQGTIGVHANNNTIYFRDITVTCLVDGQPAIDVSEEPVELVEEIDPYAIIFMLYGQPTPLLRFTLDDLRYYYNDTPLMSDVAPFVSLDRTMVPLRIVAEAVGATIRWEDSIRTAYIYVGDEMLSIPLDVLLPGGFGTAEMINDRVLVPAQFIVEIFDSVSLLNM